MSRKEWAIIGVLLVSVVVVFCMVGVLAISLLQAPTVTNEAALVVVPGTPTLGKPTATPYPTWPPTYTSTPAATATWVIQPAQPRAVATAIPRTRVPGPISNAWDKMAQTKSMRFEIDMSVKGNLTGFPGATSGNQELSLLYLSGEMNNKDSHLILKGFIASFLGADASKGLEMISVGDKVYLHGPLAMMGAPEAKWYVGSADNLKTSSSIPQASDLASSYGALNPDWSGFKKTGNEKLDGRQCDIYSSDKESTNKLFQSLASSGVQNLESLDQLDDADAKFWICDDGYVHQMRMSMTGHSASKPSEKTSFQIRLRFSDINNTNLKISAPTGAAPLQMPSFVPTPKK